MPWHSGSWVKGPLLHRDQNSATQPSTLADQLTSSLYNLTLNNNQTKPIQSPIPKSEHDTSKSWTQEDEAQKAEAGMNSRGRRQADWEDRQNKRVIRCTGGSRTEQSTQKTSPHMSTFVVRDFGVTLLKVHQRLNNGICTSKDAFFALILRCFVQWWKHFEGLCL